MDFDPSLLQSGSLLGYILVFVGGVVTSIGPCNVAMIPLVMAYIGGVPDLPRSRAFTLSTTFALGLALTYVALGVTTALIGELIGLSYTWGSYLVAAVCILLGLQMLGIVHLPSPGWFSNLRQKISLRGIPGALALGLVSGLVASQCATPALAAILTYVLVSEEALLYGASLLFIYALGRGVPIVLAGTFTGALRKMRSLGKWSQTIEKISGVLMIAIGLYFLWIA